MGVWFRCCFAFLLFALTACESTVSTNELNSGLPEQTVVDIMGEPPLNRSEFSMPDSPNNRFTVLEYNMASQRDWAPTPHWILFDADGLVTYGEGGVPEAQTRAYGAYFDWMSGHGKMSYQEAESRIYARYKEVYGRNLNPAVDQYLQRRIEVLRRLDAGEIDKEEAQRIIWQAYLEQSRSVPFLSGEEQPDDDGSAFGRAAAVTALGPDLSVYRGRRPRAAQARGRPCPSAGGGRTQQLRCF